MRSQQKTLAVAAGLGLALVAWRRKTDGRVLVGPVTYTEEKVDLGSVTDSEVQRLSLALVRSRQLMGADPNTLASRQPSPSELGYIEETLASARLMSQMTKGGVPYPMAEEQRLALARKLPSDALQKANAQFYVLLGIDPLGMNEPTLAPSAQGELLARSLIAKWRPYSQSAVDTLFVQLDEARELGEAA